MVMTFAILIVGIGLGAAVALFVARTRVNAAEKLTAIMSSERDVAVAGLESLRIDAGRDRDASALELTGVRDELATASTALARVETTLEGERRAHGERLKELQATEGRIDERVKAALTDALGGSTKQLVAIAKAELGKERVEAKRDIDAEQKRMAEVFGRVDQTLGKVAGKLEEVERDRITSREQLAAQLRTMRESQSELMAGTQALVGALRRPHVRGRWGEVQLRNIIEAAGMLPHVDFDEQVSLPGEDGVLRPDACLHLPGSRDVIVDAKVPLEAFMESLSATDPAEQERLLTEHARHLRTHLTALDSKSYWERLERSPDFVIMFIPNDQVLLAAMEADRTLAQEVERKRVVIATPMNLMALLRIIALGWRQEALAENAREIESLGRELYTRLGGFAAKLQALGKRVGTLVRGYNEAIASFESRVLPSARRMAELGTVAANPQLHTTGQVALVPRDLRARELDARPALEAGGATDKVGEDVIDDSGEDDRDDGTNGEEAA
jgi:DNA recombination protein RmuC